MPIKKKTTAQIIQLITIPSGPRIPKSKKFQPNERKIIQIKIAGAIVETMTYYKMLYEINATGTGEIR